MPMDETRALEIGEAIHGHIQGLVEDMDRDYTEHVELLREDVKRYRREIGDLQEKLSLAEAEGKELFLRLQKAKGVDWDSMAPQEVFDTLDRLVRETVKVDVDYRARIASAVYERETAQREDKPQACATVDQAQDHAEALLSEILRPFQPVGQWSAAELDVYFRNPLAEIRLPDQGDKS